MNVKAWRETVLIPTYGVGTKEKNPIFLEKRVYQGSSGVVYPYPVIEKILDEKADQPWQAIFLENQYLKIMILPELGGRVQMAYDKVKQRHFVYYNQVIKPALVGLTGPWISGGIEFNWPQHHRPTTYDPVDALIETREDGSVTVWCSEVERMFRTKGMAGFTLYPDKAYLEVKVQLYNRTPHPQTFLWWANPAVKVNEAYQSVFPPDVRAVFDHGKRDVSTFPVATGTYYKVDYSAGVDISRYSNIPVPTSYMAETSRYNFVGGYENDSQGGLMHVADHHQSPGKKQWTWGNGDFGQAWDRNLTDEDGPYIELMCGVYTENQPDFSWLQPYEEKGFSQYFMPYRDLGVVKNATKEAMINVEAEADGVRVRVYATGVYPGARICLKQKGVVVAQKQVDLTPEMSVDEVWSLPSSSLESFEVSVLTAEGRMLVDWRPEPTTLKPVPEPAKAALDPKDITSVEQLYLQGLHLEQMRHATYSPTDYYQEALKRDPGDSRSNNAMGLWLMKRGRFADAEPYFRTAVNTLMTHNQNPYEGEPLYQLGLCLRYLGRLDEAYDWFFKATWNAAWQDSGFFQAALIDTARADYIKALELVNRSLWRNGLNHKASHLKIVLLRLLGQSEAALKLAETSLALDRFNSGALYETYLLTSETSVLTELKTLMRDDVHAYIEYALDYAQAGRYKEAMDLLDLYVEGKLDLYPMALYIKGFIAAQQGELLLAEDFFDQASRLSPDYCFPNKLEELVALQLAVRVQPADAKAWYYLGNFWYGARQHQEAIRCWEASREADATFPTVHRNLALAYYNKQHNPLEAKVSLEKAFELDPTDARVLMELDQLYKKMGVLPYERLAFLERYPDLVNDRDDLYLERATLYNLTGQEVKALDSLLTHRFHPWEGGEGKVTGQYVFAHLELGKKAIRQKAFQQAVEHLAHCFDYPDNLGEGKLIGAQENDVYYWLGCAYEGLGDKTQAHSCWEKAAVGSTTLHAAMYYNDQQPDKLLYQGLALLKLGRESEARSRFYTLLRFGEKQLFVPFKMDFFAVSLPDLLIFEDNLQKRHELHCHYLMGLGHLGLGHMSEATAAFEHVLAQDPYHIGALLHSKLINQ